MPQDSNLVKKIIQIVENICSEEKLNILGWCNIPTDNACLSLDEDIVKAEPVHYQLLLIKMIIFPKMNLKENYLS